MILIAIVIVGLGVSIFLRVMPTSFVAPTSPSPATSILVTNTAALGEFPTQSAEASPEETPAPLPPSYTEESTEAARPPKKSPTPEQIVTATEPPSAPVTPLTGKWQLVFFINQALLNHSYAPVLPGTIISATFGSDGHLTGSAGCNTYDTTYTETEENAAKNALEISSPIATQQFCAAPTGIMDQENAYLALLSTAASYQVSSNRLEIFDKQGQKIMVFIRWPASPG